MDDKKLLEQIDKSIDEIKKTSDISQIANMTLSAMTIIFFVFVAFSGFSMYWERSNLKELKEDLKTALNPLTPKADVVILSDFNQELEGQTIEAKILSNNKIKFNITLRNIGNTPTDPLFVKTYTNDPLHIGPESSDEPEFDHELVIPPEAMEQRQTILPINFSMRSIIGMDLKDPLVNNAQASYPMLLKVYYGGTHPTVARFRIKLIKEKKIKRKK